MRPTQRKDGTASLEIIIDPSRATVRDQSLETAIKIRGIIIKIDLLEIIKITKGKMTMVTFQAQIETSILAVIWIHYLLPVKHVSR